MTLTTTATMTTQTATATRTNPLAFGYVSVPDAPGTPAGGSDTDDQAVHAAVRDLAAFAAAEGYTFAGVYADRRGHSTNGLYAMVDALRRGRAAAVVVTDLNHLRHSGCLTGADLPTAAHYLQARILVMPADSTTTSSSTITGGTDTTGSREPEPGHDRDRLPRGEPALVQAGAGSGAGR
jgi:predicted aconitase with swiveling domain